MADQFIAQTDETCSLCGSEIPKGAWFGQNKYDDPICQDCIINMETKEYESEL